MTTIIVVVVVALVFFVAVCVMAFMVWKRESEMRTDSIRAIEENLEKLTSELSAEQQQQAAANADGHETFSEKGAKRDIKKDLAYVESVMAESAAAGAGRGRNWDPFGWVRDTEMKTGDNVGGETDGELTGRTEHNERSWQRERPEQPDNREKTGYIYMEGSRADDTGTEAVAGSGPGDTEAPGSTGEETEGSHDDPDAPDGSAEVDGSAEAGGESADAPEALDAADATDASDMPESADAAEVADAAEPNDTPEAADDASEPKDAPDTADADDSADDEDHYGEIDLDSLGEMVMADDGEPGSGGSMGYDVGRSGRRYTESELEALIKE